MPTETITTTQEPLKVEGEVKTTTDAEAFYGKTDPEVKSTDTPTDQVKTETITDAKVEDLYELKLSEDTLIDPATLKEFTEYSKEKGISKEVAQEILDKQNGLISNYVKNQNEQYNNEIKQWAESAKVDKEVGGANFTKSAELAKRVIEKWGTPALKDELNKGLGNHPEALRIFARIGKEIFKDDEMVHANAGSKTVISTEQLFYGNANKGE